MFYKKNFLSDNGRLGEWHEGWGGGGGVTTWKYHFDIGRLNNAPIYIAD